MATWNTASRQAIPEISPCDPLQFHRRNLSAMLLCKQAFLRLLKIARTIESTVHPFSISMRLRRKTKKVRMGTDKSNEMIKIAANRTAVFNNLAHRDNYHIGSGIERKLQLVSKRNFVVTFLPENKSWTLRSMWNLTSKRSTLFFCCKLFSTSKARVFSASKAKASSSASPYPLTLGYVAH